MVSLLGKISHLRQLLHSAPGGTNHHTVDDHNSHLTEYF